MAHSRGFVKSALFVSPVGLLSQLLITDRGIGHLKCIHSPYPSDKRKQSLQHVVSRWCVPGRREGVG